jgi:hypothetical protein
MSNIFLGAKGSGVGVGVGVTFKKVLPSGFEARKYPNAAKNPKIKPANITCATRLLISKAL